MGGEWIEIFNSDPVLNGTKHRLKGLPDFKLPLYPTGITIFHCVQGITFLFTISGFKGANKD